MIHDPLLPRAGRLHPMDCSCTRCAPPAPSEPRLRDSGAVMAIATAAGGTAGILATWAYDALTDGPGLGVILGW